LIWNQVKQIANPTARNGHTIVSFNKVHVLFGGVDSESKKDSKVSPNNTVYQLKLQTV